MVAARMVFNMLVSLPVKTGRGRRTGSGSSAATLAAEPVPDIVATLKGDRLHGQRARGLKQLRRRLGTGDFGRVSRRRPKVASRFVLQKIA